MSVIFCQLLSLSNLLFVEILEFSWHKKRTGAGAALPSSHCSLLSLQIIPPEPLNEPLARIALWDPFNSCSASDLTQTLRQPWAPPGGLGCRRSVDRCLLCPYGVHGTTCCIGGTYEDTFPIF